jgi:DNA topoisomerase I
MGNNQLRKLNIVSTMPKQRAKFRRKLLINLDPGIAAQRADLRYVTDAQAGIRRQRSGKGFVYLDPNGRRIRARLQLHRFKSLVIPPAWEDVWICSIPNGHLQVTGRDAKGRKQYRYHPRWREVRDETKYTRMLVFGQSLPLIRKRTEEDMRLPGLPRRKVLATIVRLLEVTLIRVGNEEYARTNQSFGLTTMRNQHVEVSGSTVRFEFQGKGRKRHRVALNDRRLARIVQRCQEIPGYELFQYLDEEGQRQSVDSSDVNEYLKETTQEDFTAKDFRTWAGTLLAALALQEFEAFDSNTQAKRNIVAAIKSVAERLGNTPSICRKCYIHPAVIDSYLEGTMLQSLKQRTEQAIKEELKGLRPEEAAVMGLLQQRFVREMEKDQRKAS